MTWAAPAPTYAPPYAPQPHVVRYAGFWRRFWGLWVDQLLVGLVSGIVGFVVGLAARLLVSATTTCDTYQSGGFVYRQCGRSSGLVIFFGIVQFVLALVVWYRIVPRRLAEGATPGMHQLGLQVQTRRDGLLIGVGAAVARSLLPGALQFGGLAVVASVFIFSFDPDAPVQDYWWWVGLAVGLVVACYGAALWSLVDRRHQTLYDKIVGSVVVEERDVNWCAVFSFGCAMTVVLAPVAIVLGHVGLHQLAEPHNRQAGHGLGAWGTALGYLFTVVGLLILAIVVLAGKS